MQLETYEDVAALSPADALTLGYVGDGAGVRAERAETAERVLGEFAYSREAMTRGAFPQFHVMETLAFSDGSVVAALDDLEREAANNVQHRLRPGPGALTREQVSQVRAEVIAPMPQPAPPAQIRQMDIDYREVEQLRRDARFGPDPVASAREASVAARTFENAYGIPPIEKTDDRSQPDFVVVEVEQYLRDGDPLDPDQVARAAVVTQDAVAAAESHFARVSEQEVPDSARYRAAENTLHRLGRIQDRINVSSYAGWGVDGITLGREQDMLRQTYEIESRREYRDAIGMSPAAPTVADEYSSQRYERAMASVVPGEVATRTVEDAESIAEVTFNDEKIDAVADARIQATALEFGESLADASVDLASWTHGWDRVQVHVDADDRVRADVIGPNAETDAGLPAVAAALGIDETEARQAVMEAAHQLQRGQIAYDAASDSDADERVAAFDQDGAQQARDSLNWSTDNTREQEQTMSEINPQTTRQELLDQGYPSEYIDGPEYNTEGRPLSADYEDWDVTGGPVRPGDDVGLRVDDDGGVHATVIGSEGVVTRDADPSQLATAWGVDEDAAQQEAVQWASDGTTPAQDLRWAGPEQPSANAAVESQNNEPDVDEMVNMGMADDRSVARQGQDRADPARQRVDMQQVQEQIASLDAVGAGHHDRYSFEDTQPTQGDPTMRM